MYIQFAIYRCWQEKGYLLIYITGRPLIQKEHILSFLGAHRFPLGLVACADSLSPDSQTFKTMYLARLIKEVRATYMYYSPPPNTHTPTPTHHPKLKTGSFTHFQVVCVVAVCWPFVSNFMVYR